MAHKIFFDADGKRINRKEWERLKFNPDYYNIERYLNDRLSVTVKWLGFSTVGMFPEYMKLFVVDVHNLIPSGVGRKKVTDPNLTRYFPSKELAVAHYRQVLLDTRCATQEINYEGETEFTEIDNQITMIVEKKVKDERTARNNQFGSW